MRKAVRKSVRKPVEGALRKPRSSVLADIPHAEPLPAPSDLDGVAEKEVSQ